MNMKALLIAVVFFLLVVNGARVESRRLDEDSDDQDQGYKLFVFGDSYADNGNLEKSDKSWTTRAWYYPYGISDSAHDQKPTGRSSNGMVQSDFIAKILGLNESPPAERLRDSDGVDYSSGVNFAVSGAGAGDYEGSDEEVPNLGAQINKLERLVGRGNADLTDSVALIAFSGSRDYADVNITSSNEVVETAQDVTDLIADGVDRLKQLGVAKVLVNELPPMGCRPWDSRPKNYEHCDSAVNVITTFHNMYLRQKLGNKTDSVLLLDMKSAFTDLVVFPHNGPSPSDQFENKYTPCCDSIDPVGYCGQEDEDGSAQYSLCDNPDEYFFWDYMHPTEAGWKAVAEKLEQPIKDFLGISG
ncbi:hypothetical protein ACP70R_004579 [Stipagrostis hirtigluma subsp. patula]